jgi:hypothetical protein
MIHLTKITHIMTEQHHQRLQRHSGVDQCGRICVAQLMRGGVAEPGGFGGAFEFGAYGVLG